MDYEEQDDRIIIKRADLYEISIVDEPSDRAARIESEHSIDAMESEADATRMLSAFGMSEAQARSFLDKIDDILYHNRSEEVDVMQNIVDILKIW